MIVSRRVAQKIVEKVQQLTKVGSTRLLKTVTVCVLVVKPSVMGVTVSVVVAAGNLEEQNSWAGSKLVSWGIMPKLSSWQKRSCLGMMSACTAARGRMFARSMERVGAIFDDGE